MGRTSPNLGERIHTPPALFSMATRPIRQPPATETDLPCVPGGLIFLSCASPLLLAPLPWRVCALSSSPAPTAPSRFFLLLHRASRSCFLCLARAALYTYVLFCPKASFFRPVFVRTYIRIYIHTDRQTGTHTQKRGEKSCGISFFCSSNIPSRLLPARPFFSRRYYTHTYIHTRISRALLAQQDRETRGREIVVKCTRCA